MKKSLLFIVFAVSFGLTAFSQNKLVLDDRLDLVSGEVEELLKEKLAEEDILYETIVNYKTRCEYYFSEITGESSDAVLTIKDCDDRLIGRKNLGSRIVTVSSQEKVVLLSYAVMDILNEPGKFNDNPVSEAEMLPLTPEMEQLMADPLVNEHDTRYFFAPSAYNLKKGELYYNTVYFLLHDIQYGITDHISIGMGTTIIGMPMYFTPKVSIPVGEKSAIAIGDMLIVGTYGTNFFGNLAYGNFTTGGVNGNVSLGMGYLATNESDIAAKTSSAVFNLSGMVKVSPLIYLLSENYVFGIDMNQYAYDERFNEDTQEWEYLNEEFIQRQTIWYGIAGVRIVNKNKGIVSWQIGITYVANFPGEVPAAYRNWNTDNIENSNVIAFPTVSYTRKFGKKF